MACLVLGNLLLGSAARGAGVETLLMPGKVSAAHAKYEQTCSLCHDRANRERQMTLCLDCHKDTANDITNKTGLHGRMRNADTTQCKACHSEHLGRTGDIVKFDQSSFEHEPTDFPLDGAHRGAPCASCHKRGAAFRTAPKACGSCHKADDLHRGGLGLQCQSCHTTIAWTGARFDHGKTKFPLRDAHTEVRCNACHIGARYAGTPKACVDCHATDDAHRGSRGEKCADCHSQVSWKTTRFDHAKETGFALLGTHAALDCAGCHASGKFTDELPRECVGCHRADDAHASRFGTGCADCHGHDRWSDMSYDHAKAAKYALTGAHAKLDCHACHSAAVSKQKLGTECLACHAANDPHAGSFKDKCDSCHSTDAWRNDIRFDHDLTNYPLVGMHVMVTCAQCHATKSFKGAPQECVACHASTDVHKGGLGRDCAVCHNPNRWTQWEFDHGAQTRFALAGAHSKAACVACHRRPAAEVKLARDCAACHRNDDIHLGQYGMQCQRCHNSITFKGARIQ